MKTIKKGKEVKRVGEDEAARLVALGWEYCPKREWKKFMKDKEILK